MQVKQGNFYRKSHGFFGISAPKVRHTTLEREKQQKGGWNVSKKAWAATGLFGAIAVAGAVGLLMSGGSTAPRRMANRTGKMMDRMGSKMQGMMHSMGKH